MISMRSTTKQRRSFTIKFNLETASLVVAQITFSLKPVGH
jgi:hypothetical protein